MDPPTPRLRRTGRRRTEIAWHDGATNLLYGFRMAFDNDAVGRRLATAGGAGTEWHVHDGMHVIADTDGNGNLLRAYTWGVGIDNLLAMTAYGPTTTNTFQAITDHLGTVHAFVDENGDTVESYELDAWGNVLGVYDANGQSIPTSGLGNRYLFQGREYSWATGLAVQQLPGGKVGSGKAGRFDHDPAVGVDEDLDGPGHRTPPITSRTLPFERGWRRTVSPFFRASRDALWTP
jgi:hypothetical protein